MKVILKEGEDAELFFEHLISKVADRVTRRIEAQLKSFSTQPTLDDELWVSSEQAKKILGVKSKNKMQELRDGSPLNGLKVSQHGRIYRYFKPSLYKFLEKKVLK
ncbi:MAG: hypothetical protein ABJQ69_03780 [Ekhidna sp.]